MQNVLSSWLIVFILIKTFHHSMTCSKEYPCYQTRLFFLLSKYSITAISINLSLLRIFVFIIVREQLYLFNKNSIYKNKIAHAVINLIYVVCFRIKSKVINCNIYLEILIFVCKEFLFFYNNDLKWKFNPHTEIFTKVGFFSSLVRVL